MAGDKKWFRVSFMIHEMCLLAFFIGSITVSNCPSPFTFSFYLNSKPPIKKKKNEGHDGVRTENTPAMNSTNRPFVSSNPKAQVSSSKMSKKKAQSPDRVAAAAKLPSSPVSASIKSQPSTPVNNDDPSTWTKSKKKRMRQKRKREESAKKLLEGSGESSTPVSSPQKQSESTSKNDTDDTTNKRQKVEATKQSPADANTDTESSPKTKQKKKKSKKKKKDVATDDDAAESITQNPSTEKKSNTSDTKTTINSSSSKPQMKISLPKPSMMSTLQKTFLERLTSSRFRELNEDLYTKPSQDSFQQFTENPELFDQYHVGFRKQAKEWPVNPVDVIYKKIVSTWKKEVQGNKKSKQRESVVVADFGCGDAKLAERLLSLKIGSDGQLVNQPSKKGKKGKQSSDDKKTSSSCPFDVHSFDLVSGGNPLVTPADMSNVPLSNESIDVGVYCLALMGTNVADFVRESWRVLKFNGVLRVAEVRSRFETASAEASKSGDNKQNKGKFGNHKKLKSRNNAHHQNNRRSSDDTEDDGTPQPLMLLDEFMALMQRCGFQCTNMDRSNKMFLFMDFVKVNGGSGLAEHENFSAKPCIYKRR